MFNFNTCSLVSFHCTQFSLHVGVYRDDYSVYRNDGEGGEYVDEFYGWLWGKATEPYDHIIDYFGMGPFALIALPNGNGAESRGSLLYKLLSPLRNHY